MIFGVAGPEKAGYEKEPQDRSDSEEELIPEVGNVLKDRSPGETTWLNSIAESNSARVFESAFLRRDLPSVSGRDYVNQDPEVVIFDGANELRISIKGKFAGKSVRLVKQTWTDHSARHSCVGVTVDISAISDYDETGRMLLRAMFHHGIKFAAATAASLCFLSEISSSRRGDVTMLAPKTGEPVVSRVGIASGVLI